MVRLPSSLRWIISGPSLVCSSAFRPQVLGTSKQCSMPLCQMVLWEAGGESSRRRPSLNHRPPSPAAAPTSRVPCRSSMFSWRRESTCDCRAASRCSNLTSSCCRSASVTALANTVAKRGASAMLGAGTAQRAAESRSCLFRSLWSPNWTCGHKYTKRRRHANFPRARAST